MKKSIFFILTAIITAGCGPINLYEKQAVIPAQEWFYDYNPQFKFTISDTVSPYQVYLVLRHTDQYQYKNIWLQLGTQAPGDTMSFQKINLVLGNDKTGWEGTGMDDIFEVRKNISPGPLSFKKAGEYTFSVAQIMRQNPLHHVMNVGLRIEKVAP